MTTIAETGLSAPTSDRGCCRPTWLENTVTWIRADRDLPFKVAMYALTFFATLFLTATLVGIPLVILAIREWSIQESTPPPPLLQDAPIKWADLKTATRAKQSEVGSPQQTNFNHETDRYRDICPFTYNQWHETNGSAIAFPFAGIDRAPASPQYVAMCAPRHAHALGVIRAFCEDKTPVILTLTGYTPGRAEPYMPQNEGSSLDLGEGLSLTCTGTKAVTFGTFNGMEKTYSFTQDGDVVHTFTEIQITDWEDMTGGNAPSLIALMQRVDEVPTRGAPIVVSCSAGVGRTGTFIVAHQIKQHVERGEPFKVNELLLDLRVQREGAVQKEAQYATLFEVAEQLTQT